VPREAGRRAAAQPGAYRESRWPYGADASVTFSGTGSSDPDNNLPLTYAWAFGDGTTGTGATPSKTYTVNGTYTRDPRRYRALGLASVPASTTVTNR